MLSIACALLFAGSASTPPKVTIESLLREMSDRSAVARLPELGFKLLHASSYDRLETDPKDPKTWFANNDYGQFIRQEQHRGRTEWVVMEHDGPGAITHIWTPLSGDKDKMLIRVYLDGSDRPTIEEPFNDLMRGKRSFRSPFAFVSWAEPRVESGVGSDLYYPIPFAKRCKVTMSEVPFYYSIDYRAYSKEVSVQSFTYSAMDAAADVAERVGRDLARPVTPHDVGVRVSEVNLRPRSDFVLPLPHGDLALNHLSLSFSHIPDLEALRTTVVEMRFDGERTVWAPIGEFFGCGVHDRPVWDRYRTVQADGKMSCNWTMPYKRTAEIRFHNLGATPVSFVVVTGVEPWHWDARSMYFHTTWRSQYPLATRPMSDWNYLFAKGRGAYVGDTLTVFSPASAWYGEGDERIYVDSETFPSHLGTGTEDYYGYAWGMAEHYSSPFIAMPERDLKGRDNWKGYTTTSRLRALDAIPFTSSLKFDMEIWNWADCKVGYAAATFWYARPGATSNREPAPQAAASPLPEWSTGIKGALECENMKVLAKAEGVVVSTQNGELAEGGWSNDAQLFLQCTKQGDFVELQVPVRATGKYHVLLYGTKSYDYGIVRILLDGHPTRLLDLWSAKPIATGAIDLGEFELKKGQSVLRAEVVGTNPHSTGSRFYFGLDCLVLKPR